MHITCNLEDKPGALHLVRDDEQRITVTLEGVDAAPRSVSVPHQTPVELIGRQLSDRERDPIFRESMQVAQSLARSALG